MRFFRGATLPLLFVPIILPSAGFAQSLYLMGKGQNFIQTSATGAVADPAAPFAFGAQSAVATTLTLPSGATQVLPPSSSHDAPFGLGASFASKAALDAAYPNGTYRLTGAGVPALTFNLTTESYPAATPQVTGGNWNAGGVLVVDPTQVTTLNFSPFSTYASGGAGGHMEFFLDGFRGEDLNLEMQANSLALLGQPATPAPFTSFTIPAGRLVTGRVYSGELSYWTLTTVDTTTAPGSVVGAFWSKKVAFYVAALAPGTTPQPVPSIAAQPVNAVAPLGGSATFTVGLPPGLNNGNLVGDWLFNGDPVGGSPPKFQVGGTPATQTLTITNITAADVGSYSVRLINTGGVVVSNAATLTIGTPSGPTVVRQPVPQNVAPGSTVVFSVGVINNAGVTYQWQFNGGPLPAGTLGANGPTLVLPNVTAVQAGFYNVVVRGGTTQITSINAELTVSPNATNPGRLVNLSILTPLAAGETMTLGTVLGGAGTSGTTPLLARAAGPSLAPLGVTGFMPDPSITLTNTSATPNIVVATNNDWGGASALSSAFSLVGAFNYVNATSKDAAIFQAILQPGNYTVDVRDASGGSGNVIAELYDATLTAPFSPITPRLVNVSVLKQIATGTSLTAGFVIGGSTAKTVLIRAIGPTLGQAPFNIPGTMADPTLTLNSGANVIATNNDWSGDPAYAPTANRIGAFAVTNGASRDAMLLITLAPGSYTAQVSPIGAGGTAIVEVYEVP